MCLRVRNFANSLEGVETAVNNAQDRFVKGYATLLSRKLYRGVDMPTLVVRQLNKALTFANVGDYRSAWEIIQDVNEFCLGIELTDPDEKRPVRTIASFLEEWVSEDDPFLDDVDRICDEASGGEGETSAC